MKNNFEITFYHHQYNSKGVLLFVGYLLDFGLVLGA